MENDKRRAPIVKRFSEENPSNNRHRENPDAAPRESRLGKLELAEMCLRIDGYLRGCVIRSRGAIGYKIWDKRQFARKTAQGGKGKARSVSHVEQAMTYFRKTSTRWKFEDVWIREPDSHRVHRRIKISPAGSVAPDKQCEVTARFIGYVTASVTQNGCAHVDKLFLQRFVQTTGLPWEFVRLAWQRVKKIPGYRVRWRGAGRGRKFVVSLPYFSTRSSSPTERRETKTVGALRPIFPSPGENRGAHGAPVVRDHGPGEILAPDGAGTPHPPQSASSRNKLPSGPPPSPAQARRDAWLRRTAPGALVPFQAAGRWISDRKLLRLAAWLAVGPMKALHGPGVRVYWRFPHTRNLARRMLRDGHGAPAIVEAWRRAVARSHEDACDHDLRQRPIGEGDRPKREPSAAVVYAVQILAADPRTREQRWAEFFAQPVARRAPRSGGGGARKKTAAAPKMARADRSRPRADDMAEARAALAAKAPQAATLEAALHAAGLTLAQLQKMTREEQKVFVDAAFAAQRRGHPGS